ncbi:MAG: pilus assembly protein [Deltaproteobacteria bacterium]|nr:pilus assembly protein [Deltaproteobacteria bacterium]
MIIRSTRGTAYVEFIIVIVPFMVLFLGLAQLGLIISADILVKHAAVKAARAAIVVLPDDSENADYAGVELNKIGSGGDALDEYKNSKDSGRYETIRKAARYTLAPISPKIKNLVKEGTLMDAMDTGFASTMTGIGLVTDKTVALSFPAKDGGYKSIFSPTEDVTAQVTFLFQCQVPVAKSIMCKPYRKIDKEMKKLLDLKGRIMGVSAINSGLEYVGLQSQATLPNQGRK